MFRKLRWIVLMVLIIVLISTLIVFAENWIYSMYLFRGQNMRNPVADVLITRVNDSVISAVTFSVSIVSMVIAALTFFSIDAVDHKTTLEGNYFENANYLVEYLPTVKKLNRLDQAPNESMTRYFCRILRRSSKHETFLELSRHIQLTIDSAIWLEFIDTSDKDLQEAMKVFLKRLLKEVYNFEVMKNGLSLLLDENVKLIVAVFKCYTSVKFFFKDKNEDNNLFGEYYYKKYVKPRGYECRIEDVNGNMSRNPVSRIVYIHNYSRHMVNDLHKNCFDNKRLKKTEDFFNFQDEIKKVEAKDAGTYITILNRIDNSLEEIDRTAGYNYLWKAVISETRAKIKYLLFRLKNDTDKESLREYFGKAAKYYKDAYNMIIWEAGEGIISSSLRERQAAYEKLMNSISS